MPALPAVPQVLRLTQTFNMSADLDVLVRQYVKYSGGPPTNAQLNTMAGSLASWQGTNWPSVMNSDVSVQRNDIVDLSTATSAIGSSTTATGGTRAGGPLPAGTCLLANYQIARRYRGGKPRNYFPFGSASDVTNEQQWSAGSLTAFSTAIGGWFTEIATAVGVWGTYVAHVNVSYYSGYTNFTGSTGRIRAISTPRATPVVDTVTGTTLNPRFASQRRRNRP